MDMVRFQLTASIGFTFDTTLALARMIYDGFFESYPRLKIIGAHGGGTLPFLIARMDQCFDNIPACREKIARRPSEYLAKIYVDAVVFSNEALALTRQVMGDANILYGSDYPHYRRHAGNDSASQRAPARGQYQDSRSQRAAYLWILKLPALCQIGSAPPAGPYLARYLRRRLGVLREGRPICAHSDTYEPGYLHYHIPFAGGSRQDGAGRTTTTWTRRWG